MRCCLSPLNKLLMFVNSVGIALTVALLLANTWPKLLFTKSCKVIIEAVRQVLYCWIKL